jgi:hypothetical protein
MKSSPQHAEHFGPAPHSVVLNGGPATGRYCGNPPLIDWSGLQGEFQRNALWRRFHHKRWHYLGIATEHCFIGIAIVDLGWTNTAFVYLFDRDQKNCWWTTRKTDCRASRHASQTGRCKALLRGSSTRGPACATVNSKGRATS